MVNKIIAGLVMILALIWIVVWAGSYFEPSWQENAETLRKILIWVIGFLAVVLSVFVFRGAKIP
jgi:TRAP-type C4-dicarboxylate transport system permease small subunit